MRRLPVCWSEEALVNLRRIFFYVHQDSPSGAEKFRRTIIRSVARFGFFPESGRVVPELSDQSPAPREIIVGEYRILYRVELKRIAIMTVFHGKRSFPHPLH